jgi:hypothetical protein
MNERLVLSRPQQDGPTADGTLPLTERLLGRLPGPRVAWVLAWAAVPVVAGLLPSAYVASVGTRPLPVRLLAGLVFAYAVVLAFWAVARFTRDANLVERSVSWRRGPSRPPRQCFVAWPAPWGRWRSPWCLSR